MRLLHASDCELHNAPAMPSGDCTCGAVFGAVIGAAAAGVKDAISITHGAYYPDDIPDAFTIAHAALESLGIPLDRLAEMMPERCSEGGGE